MHADIVFTLIQLPIRLVGLSPLRDALCIPSTCCLENTSWSCCWVERDKTASSLVRLLRVFFTNLRARERVSQTTAEESDPQLFVVVTSTQFI